MTDINSQTNLFILSWVINRKSRISDWVPCLWSDILVLGHHLALIWRLRLDLTSRKVYLAKRKLFRSNEWNRVARQMIRMASYALTRVCVNGFVAHSILCMACCAIQYHLVSSVQFQFLQQLVTKKFMRLHWTVGNKQGFSKVDSEHPMIPKV